MLGRLAASEMQIALLYRIRKGIPFIFKSSGGERNFIYCCDKIHYSSLTCYAPKTIKNISKLITDIICARRHRKRPGSSVREIFVAAGRAMSREVKILLRFSLPWNNAARQMGPNYNIILPLCICSSPFHFQFAPCMASGAGFSTKIGECDVCASSCERNHAINSHYF